MSTLQTFKNIFKPYSAPTGTLRFDSVILDLRASDRDQLFDHVAKLAAAHADFNADRLYAKLLELDSEGGMRASQGTLIVPLKARIAKPYLMFARLSQPIDVRAADACPVDIVMLLVSPERDAAGHVHMLSGLCRLVLNTERLAGLRGAVKRADIRALLDEAQPRGQPLLHRYQHQLVDGH